MMLLLILALMVVALRFWMHWYQPHRLNPGEDQSFDQEYTAQSLIIKHAVSALIVTLMVTGWWWDGLQQRDVSVAEWLGLTMVLTGCGIRYWAIQTLGRHFTFELGLRGDHRLVTAGPYRWVMHPSYTGTMLVEGGMTLFFSQWLVGAVLMISVVAFLYRRIRDEEAMLRDQFGAEFDRYRASRARLIPGVI